MKTKFHRAAAAALLLCGLSLSGPSAGQNEMMPCEATPTAPIFGVCIRLTADPTTVMGEAQMFSRDSDTDYSARYSNAEEMIDDLDYDELRATFGSNYQDSTFDDAYRTGVDATIYFRGIRMTLQYGTDPAVMDRDVLVFRVPELGVRETFGGNGVTREAALDLLEDFLEGDGGEILNRISRRLIETSPVDPLAGNPSSLMGTMVDEAFQEGADPAAAAAATAAPADGQSRNNLFGAGLQFGRYAQGDADVDVFTLPLRYTFDLESGNTLTLKAPITYMNAEDAASYKIALGLAYGRTMNERWTLTPGVEYGLVGSEDLVSAGQVGAFTLTSLYELDGPRGFTVGIANMGGYYKTFPIEINDVKVDPDIENQVLKNGIILEKSKPAGGRAWHFKGYLTDTRFFGSELYADQYNEVGLFITRSKSGDDGEPNRTGLNVKYLFSPKSDIDVSGVKLSLSYDF